MLDSFEIEGFRSFSRLRVDRLGRVNLVVGRNNVGKTMFLEALRLYASGGTPLVLRNLLLERDEVIADVASINPDESEFHLRVDSLFHRWPLGSASSVGRIRVGSMNDPNRSLQIEVKMLRRVRSAQTPFRSYEIVEQDVEDEQNVTPGLIVISGKVKKIYPLQLFDVPRHRVHRIEGGLTRPAFVPARGVSDTAIARWWDAVALQDAETRVIECLRIIAPVERINLVEHPVRRGERLVMVKVAEESAPAPLKSLGDGMARMFQIALALECSRVSDSGKFERGGQHTLFKDPPEENGTETALLLLDEVENGIHYTVLPDLWRFLFRVAKIHNVQVFATSHSWDCILGLQQAAADIPDAQAMLIRLEQLRGATKAVVFDQKELAIVTRDEIEVR